MGDIESNRNQLLSPAKHVSRRGFLGQAGGGLAAATAGGVLAAEPDSNAAAKPEPASPFIWGNLLHLSYNMWCDHVVEKLPNMTKERTEVNCCRPYLRCEDGLWRDLTEKMAAVGMNLLVIDLGDGVRDESHPEIAVANAWTPSRLGKEARAPAEDGAGADPEA